MMQQGMIPINRRSYYTNEGLMKREEGDYYADPYKTAERCIRLIGLHDNTIDPSKVTLNSTFESIGLN